MKVKAIFIEEVLGACSNNPEIHREFIASKGPDKVSIEEEVEALGIGGVESKSMTVFPREKGVPFIWDYQVKGMFKGAAQALSEVESDEFLSRGRFLNKMGKVSRVGYQRLIDKLVFVKPRKILLNLPKGESVGVCQRPLRGQTAQGERVSLASSESCPADTWFEFEVVCLNKKDEELVKEWLDYGELGGFLQWRNSGKGRFKYKVIK